jgi:hypothetical protein
MYRNEVSWIIWTYCTVFGHCWTPICTVLGYWWHRSICYTCLFTTPLVINTISGYNMLWPSDVVSLSGSLISSLLSVRWSRFFLCLSSHLSLSVLSFSVAPQIQCLRLESKTPYLTVEFFRCFGFATIWLLRKLLTVKNCWVAVE